MMKKNILILSLLIILFSACTSRSQESSGNEKSPVELNPEAITSIEFDVTGMTCTGCENTVKSGVLELEGISEVDASFLNGKVVVTFDSTQVNKEEIAQEINKKGYKVTGNTGVKIN
jgi:copper chaperone CopZ